MVFKKFKNKNRIIPRNRFISEKQSWGVKNLVLFKSQRSHNSKTGKHIHKIFGVQSETSLLINCRKLSTLSAKK